MVIVIDRGERGQWRASEHDPFGILVPLLGRRCIELVIEIGIANMELIRIDSNDRPCREEE